MGEWGSVTDTETSAQSWMKFGMCIALSLCSELTIFNVGKINGSLIAHVGAL